MKLDITVRAGCGERSSQEWSQSYASVWLFGCRLLFDNISEKNYRKNKEPHVIANICFHLKVGKYTILSTKFRASAKVVTFPLADTGSLSTVTSKIRAPSTFIMPCPVGFPHVHLISNSPHGFILIIVHLKNIYIFFRIIFSLGFHSWRSSELMA